MTRRQGIMLAYPFEEKRLAKWKPPYIIEPKLDGERCRSLPVGTIPMLVSSELNPFFQIPNIIDAVADLHTDYELDGELYIHNKPFEYIHSIASREVHIHPNQLELEYHIFDIVDESLNTIERLDKIYSLNLQLPLSPIPFELAYSLDGVMEIYNEYLEQGYEGMIVRNTYSTYERKRSTYMMKFKPKKEDEYEIIGFKEEISIDGIPKDTLGAFICKGSDGTPFSVGSGLNRADRIKYWKIREQLIGRKLLVQYQHITSGKKVPRFPIFVNVIS